MAVVVTAHSGYDLGYVWKQLGGAERTTGGYYINAAQQGEAPGQWGGRGAAVLGLAGVVDREPYDAVYRQVHPQTGEPLGRRPGNFASYQAHLAKLLAAEPHATRTRELELQREAAQATRQSPAYTDVTVSFSKSISVLHASIRENARQARLAGDRQWEAFWNNEEQAFARILQQANRAAMGYLQEQAGFTRTGYHGARVDGQESGRWAEAGLVVSSWLQGTSRDGDPQDHVHNQIARMSHTDADGKWRAVDTMCVRVHLPGAQAVAATQAECLLTQRYGVEWVPRKDGRGNEIKGIAQAVMDDFSTRTVTVKEKERELAREWELEHGRTPNSRELQYLTQKATMVSRARKDDGEIDWDELAQQWDATIGGQLAGIVLDVTNLSGGGVGARAGGGWGPPARDAQVRAIDTALAVVQDRQSTWTRADLLRQIGLAMPTETRHMEPQAAQALVTALADEALASSEVACLDAPEWPPLPDSLRRGLDGRSVYTRPGTTPYATCVQLSMEERLTAQAQQQGAPHLDREHAAQRLGADAATLDTQLRERAQEARNANLGRLRMDQAAALYHVLTSDRVVEVLIGPAGTGKTYTAAVAAQLWQDAGMGPVTGTATSQTATNELRKAGVQVAENTSQLLGDLPGRPGALGIRHLEPGSLIILDEGSMVSMGHLARIVEYAAGHGCKVIITGDQEQLAAVEGGGGMLLLADRLGWVQLAEPVRFTAGWEGEASLRLRDGDKTALDDYHEHGRISGGEPEQVMEDAAKAYVAHYLDGHNVILTAAERARCRELSRRIRDDLVHLGRVDGGRSVMITEGQEASVGDLLICRKNDHRLGLANGDLLRVEEITGRGLVVRKALDADPETGERRWADHGVLYNGYKSAELGYAVTGHSAQGGTVHTGLVVVTGGESRQWLYSAMTRGAEENTAYVATISPRTADPQPGTRPAPDLERYDRDARMRQGLEVAERDAGQREAIAATADVLERDGSETSAVETQRRNLANADHLGLLHSIWVAETGDAQIRRYEHLLRSALPADWAGVPVTHQATWLWRTLRSAELAGLDAGEVIREAIGRRDLGGARDLASVIDARIRERVDPLIPQPAGRWFDRVPRVAPDRQVYVAEIAALMDDRKARLGVHIAEHQPMWATNALGPVPDDLLGRLEWERRASSIGAYRELFGYEHATEAIGPEPTGDSPEKRAAWHEAFGAMTRVDDVELHGLADGSLWHMRDSYEAETAWAPRHVGEELRATRLRLGECYLAAIRSDAEARVSQGEVAAQHERNAASHREALAVHRDRERAFAATMEDRREWERATERTRHLAVAADSELRRRHPERDIPRLRSAEPRVTEQERAELEGMGQPAWVADLEEQRRVFAEKLEERQGVMVPHEDPDFEPVGEAFPAMPERDRDAILQPPKPMMSPSERVMERAEEQAEAGG